MQKALASLARLAEKEKKDLYIVGGFVRDALRGKISEDVDLAVSEEAEQFAKRAAWLLRGHYELLDSHSQYSRIILTDNRGNPFSIDLSLQQGLTIEADLWQRDFTVNALAVRLSDYLEGDGWQHKAIDPCGGIRDLHDRILRLTSAQCLEADPVRLFRAVRFCQRLGFTLAEETEKELRRQAALIRRAQKMKLAMELFQLLSQTYAAPGMEMLQSLGILSEFFPPFGRMCLLVDGEELFAHCLDACRCLENVIYSAGAEFPEVGERLAAHLQSPLEEGCRPKIAYLRLACLLHDLGKVDCGGRPHSPSFNHEIAAEVYVNSLGKQLCFTEKEVNYLVRLVCNHSRPAYLADGSLGSSLRFFRQFREMVPELILLSAANEAARKGRNCRQAAAVGKVLVPYFCGHYDDLPEPVVSAQDIMQFFNLPPVRAVGGYLENVYAAQLDGLVKTKGDALAWVSRLMESCSR